MTSQLWELHCTDTSVAQGAGVIAQGAGATRNSGSGSRTASQLWELHGNGAQGADATRDRSSGSCMYGLVAQGAAVTGVTCTSMSRGTPVCIRGNPGELCWESGGTMLCIRGKRCSVPGGNFVFFCLPWCMVFYTDSCLRSRGNVRTWDVQCVLLATHQDLYGLLCGFRI